LLHTLLIQLSIIYKCGDLRLPRRTALFDRQAVDGAVDGKDRTDPPRGFVRLAYGRLRCYACQYRMACLGRAT
jgi:hypothetical protein